MWYESVAGSMIITASGTTTVAPVMPAADNSGPETGREVVPSSGPETQNGQGACQTSAGADSDPRFCTDHLNNNLARRSIRATAVTFVSQGGTFVLRLAGTVVLARLLVPEDYGLVAMVTAFIGFVGLFNDLGLPMAMIQMPRLDHREASTFFWVTLAASIALMVLMWFLAPLLSWFYGEDRLVAVTIILASTLLIKGLCYQHSGLLKRNMRFGSLAAIEIISTIVGLTVGVAWAWNGAGYWALVAMQVASPLVTSTGVWLAAGWCPGRPGRLSAVTSQIKFGTCLTGSSILSFLTRNVDNVLIGWWYGADQLGLYNRAYQLLLLPIQQIQVPVWMVALPTLSRLQADPERYRRYYSKALTVLAFLMMPLVLTMAALSDELILIVLGPQWLGASPIFKVLAFVALVQPLTDSTSWVLSSLGRSDVLLRWGLVSAPLIILGFVAGLPWGGLGVAASYTVCTYLLAFPCLKFTLSGSPVTPAHVFGAVWRPAVLSVAMFAMIMWMHSQLAGWAPIWVVVWSFLAGVLLFVGALILWPRARSQAASFLPIARVLISGRGSAGE